MGLTQNRNNRRDLYAQEGLRYMPKLLSMLDQNPLSATYGCGDRQYWLYKQIDFPSGMYGEYALPLALVYCHPFPQNPFFKNEKIFDLIRAVITFQDHYGHRDGSVDDFFPYERALGACAFSLYTMAEAVRLMGMEDDRIISFLNRRARWIAKTDESGRLSNHHALAALALAVTAKISGEKNLYTASKKFRDRVLSWQTEEGWFLEYDGCDPGYDTFTISFLSYLRKLTEDDVLSAPLARAVHLAADLIWPDGSYGGEIGHRNSYHFLPHGFELLASELEPARFLSDLFLKTLENKTRSYLDENRTFCHYQYNYLQSWVDYGERTEKINWQQEQGLKIYKHAGLVRLRKSDTQLLMSSQKGGIFKVADSNGPLASDTGVVVREVGGKTGSMTMSNHPDVEVIEDNLERIGIRVRSDITGLPNQILPTPGKFIIFRILNLTLGRINADFFRRILQRLLIKPQGSWPISVLRTIYVLRGVIEVEDELISNSGEVKLSEIMSSTDLSAVFAASSNSWHGSRLFKWLDREEAVVEFNKFGRAKFKRIWRLD